MAVVESSMCWVGLLILLVNWRVKLWGQHANIKDVRYVKFRVSICASAAVFARFRLAYEHRQRRIGGPGTDTSPVYLAEEGQPPPLCVGFCSRF